MADTKEMKAVLFGPVFANNPIALQVLGICSALAVTSSLKKRINHVNRIDLGNRIFKPFYLDYS